MRDFDGRLRLTLLSILLAVAVGATTGCTVSAEKKLIGVWHTQLTGYNTVAAGVTEYDQNVEFTDSGTVRMYNTLPGDVNDVSGKYELTKIDGEQVIKITWDIPVDKPTELYYQFQGDKLLTSRAPGSLDMSQELNVGNQDPVVYVRIERLSN